MWDLGAGDLDLAISLVLLGASKVVAIEKEETDPSPLPQIEVRRAYFSQVLDTPEIVFLSWPVNRSDAGLLRLVHNAKIVIYLGCNTDSSCCGDKALFEEMSERELLAEVNERHNCLIIVGPTRVVRPPTEQEWIMKQDFCPIISFGHFRSKWCKEKP